jgi:hypothetical protein
MNGSQIDRKRARLEGVRAFLWLVPCLCVGCADATSGSDSLLAGDGDDPVETAIPEIKFERDEEWDPSNTLLLSFELGVTVEMANDVLAETHGEIVGGFPGVEGQVEGILVLRTPTETEADMDSLVDLLRDDPSVAVAAPDVALLPLRVPREPTGTEIPSQWTWTKTARGGNRGLELIGAPHMWNLVEGIKKRGQSDTVVAILDDGFYEHPDLAYSWNGTEGDHGTHVAGIIGAKWDNELGVDGVTPFADLRPFVTDTFAESITDQVPEMMATGAPVVNVSLGFNWTTEYKIDIGENTKKQEHSTELAKFFVTTLAAHAGPNGELPVFVVGAGNDSTAAKPQEARWGSPFATAGIELGAANVIVVEALEVKLGAPGDATNWVESSRFGDISAPGHRIVSTTMDEALYLAKDGTSMASPHVAGLVAFVYAIGPSFPRPTLDSNPARDLLKANDVPVGGAASNRIDAFATAMDLDRLSGGTDVVRLLVDIDDGTVDGNMRVDPAGGVPNMDEDADGDGGRGDADIDMSDFRRFRDWLLGWSMGGELDGAADHPKRDLNLDGLVTDEEWYARADFNGDGQLHASAKSYVPGAFEAEVTDLEVLMRVFADDEYDVSELPSLLQSADLHVDLGTCFNGPQVHEISVRIVNEETEETYKSASYFDEGGGNVHVHTMPLGPYRLEVSTFNAGGESLNDLSQSYDFPSSGTDTRYNPSCGGPVSYIATIIDAPGALELNDAGQVLSRPGGSGPYVLRNPDGTNHPVDQGQPEENEVHYLAESGAHAYPTIGPLDVGDFVYSTPSWKALSRNGSVGGYYQELGQTTKVFIYLGSPEDGDPTQVLSTFTEEFVELSIGDGGDITVSNNHAINDAGLLVGSAADYAEVKHAARLSGDQPDYLPVPDGIAGSHAFLVNNTGSIAGYITNPTVAPIIWEDNGYKVLPIDGLNSEFHSLHLLADDGTLFANCGTGTSGCYLILPAGADEFQEMPDTFTATREGGEEGMYTLRTIQDVSGAGVILGTGWLHDGAPTETILLTPG